MPLLPYWSYQELTADGCAPPVVEERLNQEIRRRERVIRIFPNRDSVIRLIGAVLMEQHEQWCTGRKYLDMGEYHCWCAERQAAQKARAGV